MQASPSPSLPRLQLAARTPPTGAFAPSADLAAPRPRILYVDDDESVRRLGELILARAGYQVDTAADGAAAWEALQGVPYQLLITDQEMPGRTGLELARQARQAGMGLPIVLATGSAEALCDPSADGLALAARLAKPFGAEVLIGTVRGILVASHLRLGDDPGRVLSPSPRPRLARIQSFVHGGINE